MLLTIFRRFWQRITLTFSLLTLENIVNVLQPWVIGLAINDLLAGQWSGVMLLSGLELSRLIIGTLRRLLDTRAYSSIYATLAPEIVAEQRAKGTPESAIVTRSNLVEELVQFFENDLPYGFTSAVQILGAVVMLYIFDWRLFLGCLVAIGIIGIIYKLTEGRIFRLNTELNDELEHQVEIVSKRPQLAVVKHFKRLRGWQVRLSDIESVNFALFEVVLFALIIFALFISAQGDSVTPGSIFSILSYVLEFAEGVFILPIIFQQLIRLREIGMRLQHNYL